jgi:integrase
VECLRTLANRFYGLLMDYEAITGWRIDAEILSMQRSQIGPDGVRVRKAKQGEREIWEWSPELRRIINEAAKLHGATPFPASPVFPSRRGRKMAYSTFNVGWQKLKRRVKAQLAEGGIIDPDVLWVAPGLTIDDLHFHDLRSKAHDDAEEAGIPGHEFLGNTPAVARKHYRRREQRRQPLR